MSNKIILKSKSGIRRAEFIGNDEMFKVYLWENGKNILTFTYYYCSMDESIKFYLDSGCWFKISNSGCDSYE